LRPRPRGRKAATLTSGACRYQECGLPGDTFTTEAEAIDSLGQRSGVASGPSATNLEDVAANWQAHMGAGRLRVYGPPCRSVGFGACDTDFSQIFLANQSNPFPLHRRPPSDDWYVDPNDVR